MTEAPQRVRPRGLFSLAGALVALVVLMLGVVGASAWLRLAQPRVPCGEWPACRGTTLQEARHASLAPGRPDARLGAPLTLERVRVVHRVVATAVLLGVVALVVKLLRDRRRRRERPDRPDRPGLLRPALALLGLALGLSALGVVTPGSRAAAVLLGNLLGGFLMLGLAVAVLARLAAVGPVSDRLARWAGWTFALWLAQVTLGALSGAGALHLAPPLHLALAAATLPCAALVARAALHEAQPAARALGMTLMTLVPLQFVLGALAAGGAAQVGWVLLHNTTAALAGAAIFALAALRRRPRRSLP